MHACEPRQNETVEEHAFDISEDLERIPVFPQAIRGKSCHADPTGQEPTSQQQTYPRAELCIFGRTRKHLLLRLLVRVSQQEMVEEVHLACNNLSRPCRRIESEPQNHKTGREMNQRRGCRFFPFYSEKTRGWVTVTVRVRVRLG